MRRQGLENLGGSGCRATRSLLLKIHFHFAASSVTHVAVSEGDGMDIILIHEQLAQLLLIFGAPFFVINLITGPN
jgi:hypothetical protein